MKKTILLTIMAAFLIWGCENKQEKNDSAGESKTEAAEAIEKAADKADSEKAMNCKEFLDKYEKWIDDYLKVIEKYSKNPMDPTLMGEFTQQAADVMTWYSNWGVMDCATKEKYEKRFDAINDKVDKKMKELGLD